jgi:hypothetical protein
MMSARSVRRTFMASAMVRCSSTVCAPTKRAAAAAISPVIADRRRASVIIGTSAVATRWNSRSVAEKDRSERPAATTVINATAPKAVCSLPLTPKRIAPFLLAAAISDVALRLRRNLSIGPPEPASCGDRTTAGRLHCEWLNSDPAAVGALPWRAAAGGRRCRGAPCDECRCRGPALHGVFPPIVRFAGIWPDAAGSRSLPTRDQES